VLQVVLAVWDPVYGAALRENVGQSSADSEGSGNVHYGAFTGCFHLSFIWLWPVRCRLCFLVTIWFYLKVI